MMNIANILAAYQNTSKLAQGQTGIETNLAGGPTPGQADQTFADLVKGGLETTVQASRTSEAVSADFVAGNADIKDVVGAVRNAEALLTTVTAIRDRVVSALQELSRMPI
jgi:flagellar hook-basal body complex protein FliE